MFCGQQIGVVWASRLSIFAVLQQSATVVNSCWAFGYDFATTANPCWAFGYDFTAMFYLYQVVFVSARRRVTNE